MDQNPLVIDQIDTGARFLVKFQKYARIQTAFWLKESEETESYLYVASEQITPKNFDVAYGEVVRIAAESPDPHFDIFQVKVIGADDPLAQAALEVQKRYPQPSPCRVRNRMFGGRAVDEVYIYPSPIPEPR